MQSKQAQIDRLLQKHLQLLQGVEESIRGRELVICTDLARVGAEVTTPRCLQHIGHQIVEMTKSDWTDPEVLGRVVLPYLREICKLFEAMIGGHKCAAKIFAASPEVGYCLFLRSFSLVTLTSVAASEGRVVAFLNNAELDANFVTTLSEHADWLNPVTCLHTDDMNLMTGIAEPVPAFRVHSHNWRSLLADAIASSRMIILYVDGDSPGVEFEIDRIRQSGLTTRTVVVHRGAKPPDFCGANDFAGVLSTEIFLDSAPDGTGPGKLSEAAQELLRRLSADGFIAATPSRQLRELRCEIVDPMVPPNPPPEFDLERCYFVTERTAAAFCWYLENLPESFERWNTISQNIRLRGIQPSKEDFNSLFISLRRALCGAACLGYCASMAAVLGLLAKVASMAKTRDPAKNQEHRTLTLEVTDIAARFDALTERREWGEKIVAWRESILEDPFF